MFNLILHFFGQVAIFSFFKKNEKNVPTIQKSSTFAKILVDNEKWNIPV